MRRYVSAAILLTVFAARAECRTGSTVPHGQPIVYGNNSSPMKIIFKGDRVIFGQVPDVDMTDTKKLFERSSDAITYIGAPSTAGCVAFGQTILAVPKDLKIGRRYRCAGVSFRVQSCLRTLAGRCEQVVIVSNCATMLKSKCAAPAAPTHFRQIAVGAPYFFIYNRARGVVEFVLGSDLSISDNHLILRGSRGIFAR